MQATIYDRNVLRQVIASQPTGEQATSWLAEVLKLADNSKNFTLPFPSYLINHNHADHSPASTVPPSITKVVEEEKASEPTDTERYVTKALKWAEGKTFEFAFRRDVRARDRSICRFGSHRIEQDQEIAKIGVAGKRGDIVNLWGCVPCFDAIVEEYGIEVED